MIFDPLTVIVSPDVEMERMLDVSCFRGRRSPLQRSAG